MTKMNPEIKARWVAALRSGEYKQAKGRLRSGDGFCCLGVLCELHAQETGNEWVNLDGEPLEYMNCSGILPDEVKEWSGLAESYGANVTIDGTHQAVTEHNDGLAEFELRSHTFAEIADAIEEQL